jgi:DNA-binding transcriptional LysR family regulator
MELKQIEAVVWVAWEHSFTRAADALGITQPAVSARVSTLEKELGYALFRHASGQVQITAAGELFLRYGEEMLRLAAEATSAPTEIDTTNTAVRLRIGSNTATAAGPLPQWIREFSTHSADGADFSFDITVDRTPALVPLLRAGKLELAFVSPLMVPSASKTVLHFSCPLTLAVAPGHELAGSKIPLRELAGRDAVGFVSGPSGLQLRRIQRALPTMMQVVLRSNSAFVVRDMAEAGSGILIVPLWVIESSVREGRLALVELTDYDLGAWDVAVVRWRDRAMRSQLEGFLDFMSAIADKGSADTGPAS